MSPAILNKANHGIGQVAKKFSHTYFGGEKTVSTIMKVVNITTDKESISASEEILQNVSNFIEKLPCSEDEVKIAQVKRNITKTNLNLSQVSKMLQDIDSVFDETGALIVIDDKNMQKFIANFKEIKLKLEYISDYLNLVNQVYLAKSELKKSQSSIFTYDELIKFINS